MRITISLLVISFLYSLTSWAGDTVDMPLPEIEAPSSNGFVNSFQSSEEPASSTKRGPATDLSESEDSGSVYHNAFSSLHTPHTFDGKPKQEEDWQSPQQDDPLDPSYHPAPAHSKPAKNHEPHSAEANEVESSSRIGRAPASESSDGPGVVELNDELEKINPPPESGAHSSSSSAPVAASGKERKELVLKTISDNFPQMKSCYNDGLKKKPSMHGKVQMAWTMDSQGHVKEVSVESSELNNKTVEDCMTRKLSGWQFPKNAKASGAKDRMSYTFHFDSEKD